MFADQPDNLGEQMNQALTHGYGPKVARAVLALLGAVPFVGGAFGGAAGAWSEAEQDHFNRVAASWLKLQEDEIKEIGRTIAEILSPHRSSPNEIQRAHIFSGKHRRIGKESDRRWEEGDEFESLVYRPMEFEPPGTEKTNGLVRARESLIRKIRKVGIRKLVTLGLGRRILEMICRRELISPVTLREYESTVRSYRTSGDC